MIKKEKEVFATNADIGGAMKCSEQREGLILPSLPHIVVRLLNASMDDDSSMRELSALIIRDPALAAQILRLANSPLYSGRGHVSSIESAVVKLGVKAVRCLAITLSIHQSFQAVCARTIFPWPCSGITVFSQQYVQNSLQKRQVMMNLKTPFWQECSTTSAR